MAIKNVPKLVTQACRIGKKGLQGLSDSGMQPDPKDKGRRKTRAGRGLDKNGSDQGKRGGSSAFPKPKGNHQQVNNQGQDILDDLITAPGSVVKPGNRFGGSDIIGPDGRGARFDADGNFRGFLEP